MSEQDVFSTLQAMLGNETVPKTAAVGQGACGANDEEDTFFG